jgi:hypothetical protein
MNFKPLPSRMVCHTRPLWRVSCIASHPADSWEYQAEPESPGYLAFRSEPDFQRSARKIRVDSANAYCTIVRN